ncbi:hypothetical protein BOX15_Mlig019933g1, partial [Macrostomum lignano]
RSAMGQSQSHNRQSRTPIPSVQRRRSQPAGQPPPQSVEDEDESSSPGPIESRLDEAETRRWEAAFGGLCLAGHLRRAEFRRLCAAVFPDGPLADADFADRVFDGFDESGRGAVRFREFLAGLSVAANCGPEERLRWALAVYGGGGRRLSRGEVADIFRALGGVRSGGGDGGGGGGIGEPSVKNPKQRARQLMQRLGRHKDSDRDSGGFQQEDGVTVDEFIAAVAHEPDVRARLLTWPLGTCGEAPAGGSALG